MTSRDYFDRLYHLMLIWEDERLTKLDMDSEIAEIYSNVYTEVSCLVCHGTFECEKYISIGQPLNRTTSINACTLTRDMMTSLPIGTCLTGIELKCQPKLLGLRTSRWLWDFFTCLIMTDNLTVVCEIWRIHYIERIRKSSNFHSHTKCYKISDG